MQVSCTSVTRNCLCSFHTTDFHAPMPSLMLLSTRHTPFLVQSIICHPQARCLSSMGKFYLLFTSNSHVTSCIKPSMLLANPFFPGKINPSRLHPSQYYVHFDSVSAHMCGHQIIKLQNFSSDGGERSSKTPCCCHWENEDNTTQAAIAKEATLISGGKRKRLF